jgi:hypothetical protein
MSAFCIQLEVLRPDGTREELTIQASRVLVGAGAHCDVRISGTGAGHEHLVLDLVGREIHAQAKHFAPPPYCEQNPLLNANLGQTAEIAVVGTRIRVSAVPSVSREAKGKAKRMATSAFLALVVTALPGLVYAALRERGDEPIGAPPSEVTSLFDEQPAACPTAAPDQANASATTLRAIGELQREQHPFAVADGISAVRSFDTAAACFHRAGKEREARDVAAARDALRKRIEGDYRVHRVRVEHALEENDHKAALREVKVLRKLTAGRKGAYIDWLDMVERRLEAAVPVPYKWD